MFFNSEKKKASKSIQLAIKDIVTDPNLAESCNNFTNNDESASYLYTEILIQKIHSLVFILDRKYREKYKWATWDFVSENIVKGIINGIGKTEFIRIALEGVSKLMNMDGSGQERINNLYNSSAIPVVQRDSKLNQEEVVKFIDENIKSFMMGAGKYF